MRYAPKIPESDLAAERPESKPGKDFTRGEQMASIPPRSETTEWDAVRAVTHAQQRQPMPPAELRMVLAMLDLDPAKLLQRPGPPPIPVKPKRDRVKVSVQHRPSSLDVACPACDVPAGRRCRLEDGGPATNSHPARIRTFKERQ